MASMLAGPGLGRSAVLSGAQDRTLEFQAVVQRIQSSQGAVSSSQAKHEPAESHADFTRRASAIGLRIHATSQKLAQLAALARRTSMFDDPAEEIGELSVLVKADIQALNGAIAELAAASSGSRGGPNRQAADHTHTMVDNLRGRLKDTTQEFKQVLTLRTDNLKVHADRRSLFSADSASKFEAAIQPGTSFLPTQSRAPLTHRRPSGLDHDGGATGTGTPNGHATQQQQQQQQQQQLLATQDAYLDSRAGALRQVESTITELGGIFQQLAHLVAEQGEVALRIDENVDDTLANVNAGQAQLLKYYDTISSNRWLILKVFGVLMLFLMFFVAFIA